jgi:hypothetical protein
MRREGAGLAREQPLFGHARSLGKSGHTTTNKLIVLRIEKTTNYLRPAGNSFLSKLVVVFRPCWPQGKCNTHFLRKLIRATC